MTDASTALLVVDDDPGIRKQLKWAFDAYAVQVAKDRDGAVATHAKNPAPVVLLDLGLPPDVDGPSEGLAALQGILSHAHHTKVVVMTGQRERAYALKALELGAYDYYEKPLDLGELAIIVERAFKLAALEAENRDLQARLAHPALDGVITANAAMTNVCAQIAKFARVDLSVLISGESGTGKELFAQGLHKLADDRRKGPYVALNCAAIPENLLESELFGYEKGAFTGAHKTTSGRLEQAEKGTLMLDEIGDLSMALQAKLLRVLQERKFERVGGRTSITFDARVIAATNRDLRAMVAEGTFREDLYYRLAEAVVTIPPLRDRPEDIPLIAEHYLKTWAAQQRLQIHGFTPEALEALAHHDWPGNVRELQSRIKQAAVAADGRITPADLGFGGATEIEVENMRSLLARAEQQAARRAITRAGGNLSEAARLLDISRPKLYQLLRQQGLR